LLAFGFVVKISSFRQKFIMRPKIVLAFLAVAVLAVAALILFKQHLPATAPEAVAAPATTNPPAITSSPAPTPVVKKILTPEEQQAAINAEKDKLYEWSMNNDPQSLSNILGDLVSPEKEIREAAIEATKQFGDTNAIPVLKSLAANTEDNREAIEMLEAADFISLPEATFVKSDPNKPKTPEQLQAIAASKAKSEARRQAKQGGQQNSQTSQTTSANQNTTAAQP
jgi:hypothetical protein